MLSEGTVYSQHQQKQEQETIHHHHHRTAQLLENRKVIHSFLYLQEKYHQRSLNNTFVLLRTASKLLIHPHKMKLGKISMIPQHQRSARHLHLYPNEEAL